MAIGTIHPPAADPERKQADQIIDRQLSRVRRHIRLADIVAGLMVLFAGTIAFLIAVSVIDHWVVGLGFAGRLLALLALAVGACWFLLRNLLPTLIRPINPAFAAQTIERGGPQIKNSLLNYLLLRHERMALHRVVYEALQGRAAADVARVEVEQTVDRSAMIHAGYVLVTIMSIAAAYKILSPKDPVQTVQRVFSPWADIARPARVNIEGVQPGDADLYRGQTANVSAIVRGVREKEAVRLVYSTADGQTLDREILMKWDSTGLRHEAALPPQGGARQDMRYRLIAGDGATRDFQIRVIAAPLIQVEAVEYDFPAYTKRPREIVERQGDLKAVEGTRVTVRARANQPIRAATLEFDPGRSSPIATGQPTLASEKLPMTSQNMDAVRTFYLDLSADRQSPRHNCYSVTFVNTTGAASTAPTIHRIEVIPDLAPEVEFLTPTRDRIEVPVGGRQRMEVRAVDPDYGLIQLKLKATHGSRELLDRPLLEGSGQLGQVVARYEFIPRELGLKAGDQVSYWAIAEDNRTAVGTMSPQPNTARTRTYELVVIPDPPTRQGAKGDAASSDENAGATDKADGKSSDTQKPNGTDKKQNTAKKQNTSKKQSTANKTDGAKQGEQSKKSDTGKAKQQNQTDDQQSGAKQQGKAKKEQSQEQGGAGTQNGTPSEGQSKQTEKSDSQAGQGNQGESATDESTSANGTGAGARENSPSDQTAQNGKKGESRSGAGTGNRSEPLHDGEVFEKTLERMKQQRTEGDNTKGDNSQGNTAQENTAQENTAQGNDAQSDHAQGEGKKRGEDTPVNDHSKAKPGSETSDARGGKSAGAKSPKKQGTESQEAQPKDDSHGPSDSAKATGSPGTGPEHSDKNEGAGESKPGNQGEGGKSNRNGMERAEKEKEKEKAKERSDPSQKSTEGAKKPGLGDNGESGEGQNSRDPTGSGSVEKINNKENPNSDHPKTLQPDSQVPRDPGDPGNTGEKQSDSKGATSGDKSGGGKQGPGQGAKQPGNDSAGSNSSSDDGAGKSQESGRGEKSSSGGDKEKSSSPTGAAGNEKGPGSRSVSSPQGNQQSEGQDHPPTTSPSPHSKPPEPTQVPRTEGDPKGKEGSATGNRDAPKGGGVPADNSTGSPPPNQGVPPGDAANLDYARRTTDMVLDYLRDQKDKPDQRLLDELGWTSDDLRTFLDRWQRMKESSRDDANSHRQLDESLRGLGLRPSPDTKRTGTVRTDDIRGMNEAGAKSAPPPAYQERFNAFRKGASRGPAPMPGSTP